MQIIQVGRHRVYRRYLEDMKLELALYRTRKIRLDMLTVKHEGRDPVEYQSYRSPEVGGMPGAPGHVGDPTGERVVALIETQEFAFLKAWVAGVEAVMAERLDGMQLLIIREYVMKPSRKRQSLGGLMVGRGVSEREAFLTQNEALLEFAFAFLGEQKVLVDCSNFAGTAS